jgi:STE24 endopeptidase
MLYFLSVFAFMWAAYLWETYLDLRQRNKLHETVRPKAIVDIVTHEKFEKAQKYGLDKNTFGLIKSFVGVLENSAILGYALLPYVWKTSTRFVNDMGYGSEYEITISIVFVALLSFYNLLLSLPFELYHTFVLEEKHGFNKMTLSLFVTDKIKMIGLGVAFGVPILAAFLTIVKWGGEYFYLYVWAFMFAVQMILVTIYPTVIQPCFNKMDPVPEGDLRTAIEALAKSINFPLTKLFIMDGSKRSGHSNAYFFGFCKNKRIVLFDTLVNQTDLKEVVAVLGHELGHWKLNHTVKMLAIGNTHMLFQFWLFGQVVANQQLYLDFGFVTMPTLIGFLLFQYILSPVDTFWSFVMNLITRIHEFQADAFAVALGHGDNLGKGLIKLQLENLGNMNPDKWYSTYHYSHPPLVERLEAINAIVSDKKKT